MEGLEPLYRRVAGIDVHRMLHVVIAVVERADGSIEQSSREFGGFKRDCRELVRWLVDSQVELMARSDAGALTDLIDVCRNYIAYS